MLSAAAGGLSIARQDLSLCEQQILGLALPCGNPLVSCIDCEAKQHAACLTFLPDPIDRPEPQGTRPTVPSADGHADLLRLQDPVLPE